MGGNKLDVSPFNGGMGTENMVHYTIEYFSATISNEIMKFLDNG